MRPYLSTARRYRWLLASIVALVWGAGIVAAYVEYTSTYESRAAIWVLRRSPELTITSPDDPNVAIIQTAASQQAELLNQLVQTQSFLRDVVQRTSLAPALAAAPDEERFLSGIQKGFRVETPGANLLTVAYHSHDPHIAPEMITAALAVRAERVTQASTTFSSIATTLYRVEYEAAQTQALDAERALKAFDDSHPEPLSVADEHQQAQLRLTLDYAQVRLGDLKGRIDRSALAPALLEISGMEFQVVDQPRESLSPSGGARPAAVIAAMALASGVALAALLIVLGTLIADHVGSPVDVRRLAPATLFATVSGARDSAHPDLRSRLAAAAFGDGDPDAGKTDAPTGDVDDRRPLWR